MKIKFPIKVIIIKNNSVWRTYNTKEEARKGGVVRTPYRIEDAKGRRVSLDELYEE